MPPPVVGFTSPAASPTTSTRSANVRLTGPSGRIFWRRRQFGLGRVQQQSGNAEAELSLCRIGGTARENAGPRTTDRAADRDGNGRRVDVDGGDANAVREPHARTSGTRGEPAIEFHAI